MKYCSQCGAPVSIRVPEGDHLPRHICDACDTVHYQNPKIVAGCIPEWQGRILLCRRAIEPRYGLWTLPAGFMENHESAVAAAAREAREEALACCGNQSARQIGSGQIDHPGRVARLPEKGAACA